MAGFGAPKHGGNFKPSPKSLPKEGSLTCRILPPIEGHSNFETGDWAVPHTQHFGYDTARQDDPSKRKYNVFYCVERVKWEDGQKVILQSCPEDELIEERKADYEARKAEMEKKKVPDAEIKVTLKSLVDWLVRHNRDFKYYVNVKDVNGEYYTLKLPNKAKKLVDKLCKEYRERKPAIDPIGADQGLWFIVSKTGKGFQTEYDVKVVKEDVTIQGETYQKEKKAPLTEADAKSALEKCWDLNSVGIRKLPLDKVKLLVDSGGDEETVDAIFKSSEKRESGERSPSAPVNPPAPPKAINGPTDAKGNYAGTGAGTQPKTEPPKAQPTTSEVRAAMSETVSSAPKSPPAPPAPDIDDEEAAALKALEAARARKAARAAAVPSTPPAGSSGGPAADPTPAPADDGGPSPDDDEEAFLEQFRTK